MAFHEAGHALVAASLPGTDPVRKMSIVPRGIAAPGYTQQQPTEDRYLLRKSELDNRLCQEVLLGIGGVRMLQALGSTTLSRFHMPEGHASLLALELLDEQAQRAGRLSPTTMWRSSVSTVCLPPIPRCPPVMISFHSTSWNVCSAPTGRFIPCPR